MNTHGGKLVNQVLPPEKKEVVLSKAEIFKKIVLNKEQIADVKNIAFGVYSPLTGFLKKNDFEKVVKEMRLSTGIVWPIPIVLDITKEQAEELKNEKYILLINEQKKPIALLQEPEFYQYNKEETAQAVFGATDKNHPGVANLYQMKDILLGGEIKLIDDAKDIFPEYNFTPQETRNIFKNKDWQTITAFQTRNVPHRGHEFLQKQALQQTDGLFVQPVIGEKKLADFKDEFILGAYRLLLDNFYPKNKTLLGVLPLKMRYAGPREAVLHALIRKNFGCTHFVVGRDHAGVGDYYGPFEAQEIFNKFTPEEIGITILKLPKVIWCPACYEFVFENSCPHHSEVKISFSGTFLREKIEKRELVPPYFMRPEVYHLLSHSINPLTDDMYQKHNSQNNQKGFVLWFTGLPCSGKSTAANAVYNHLKEKGITVERLDGDIVRKSLTKDLGFTKEDRDENIRRVSFVASALSKNGIGVVASFISPYRRQRHGVRQESKNYIEIFCKCPLEVCEQRDVKGMYAKAKRGEIENFTGISDPYEEPENPEITLKTDQEAAKKSVQRIIDYLAKQNLI